MNEYREYIVRIRDDCIADFEMRYGTDGELIRCKDCKYADTFREFDEPEMPMKCLGQHYGGTYPDDYCSYAERREE